MLAHEKFYKDFTKEEMKAINRTQRLPNLEIVTITKHAKERIVERGVFKYFTKRELYNAIKRGKVEKIAMKGSELRFLVTFEKDGQKLVEVIGVPKSGKLVLITTWIIPENEELDNLYSDSALNLMPVFAKFNKKWRAAGFIK